MPIPSGSAGPPPEARTAESPRRPAGAAGRLAAPLVAALLAGAAALWLTAPRPGLAPDSVSYLGAARSWAAGHGLRIPYASWSDPDSTTPLRVFPPGYPLAIGVTVRLGASPAGGARLVQAAAAAAGAAALASLLQLVAAPLAAALGTIALLLLPAIVGDYEAALSEPLFLALLLVSLALMARRPDRPLAYGLSSAAAAMTRYAGLALSAACTLWAFAQPGERRARSERAALALTPTVLVMVAWIARTRLVAHALPVSFTAPALHPGAALAQAGVAFARSLAPALDDSPWRTPASVVALALAGLAAARALPRAGAQVGSLLRVLAGFAVCYVVVVLVARTFIGHDIPFDERILSPVILCAGIVIVTALWQGWSSWRGPARVVTAGAVAVWLAGAVISARTEAADIRANGYDFDGLEWRRSPTLRWLLEHAGAAPLYTNHPVPIYFHLHRPSRNVPSSLAPDSVRAFGATLAENRGVLVAFADTSWQPGAPVAGLASRLGLRVAARFADGTVWTWPEATGDSGLAPRAEGAVGR